MTLEKILEMEFSLDNDNSTEFALKRIMFEIKLEWKIETIVEDFRTIIVTRQFQNVKGQWYNSYFVHFNPTVNLLKKFDEFPEALI